MNDVSVDSQRLVGSVVGAPARLSKSGVRLAAIDVGSNSIRLVVAEVGGDGTYRVLDEEREMTRLAEGLDRTGGLSDYAMERSLQAIAKMKAIADGFQVDELRAIATSAVREASNGDMLCREALRRLGLSVEVISPAEESRLALRSALRHFRLDGALSAVVDIGGGSVEVVLVADTVIERMFTLPLGAVRMTESFGLSERVDDDRWRRMRKSIDRSIRGVIGRPPFVPDTMIGSGGTFTAIAEAVRYRREGRLESVHGYLMTVAEVRDLLNQLRAMTAEERRAVAGINPARADIIVGGAAVIVRLAKRLGVEQILVNEKGIRDGLLLSMIARRARAYPTMKARQVDRIESARLFAAKCRSDEGHCEHVAKLALQLFDELRPVGGLPDEARDLLFAAALLHDVGYLINHAQHHKHAYHLIMHGELPGFSAQELEVIANVARYHRRAQPKKSHANFSRLSVEDRAVVRKLAGILRVADGLDRTHTARVRKIRCTDDGACIRLAIESETDPHVEVWYAEGKSELLSEAMERTLEFHWVRDGDVEAFGSARESQAVEPRVEG